MRYFNYIYHSVKDFLENNDVYNNSNGVEIAALPDDTLLVTATWPGQDQDTEFIVELMMKCKSIDAFIVIFKIKSATDCDSIYVADLIDLYNQGIGEVYCTIDIQLDGLEIIYRKASDVMFATGDDGTEHTIFDSFTTARQFKEYTGWIHQSKRIITEQHGTHENN